MELSTIGTERLANDSLQFQKTNLVLSPTRGCLEKKTDHTNGTVEPSVYSNDSNATNNNHHHDQQIRTDIAQLLEAVLTRLELDDDYPVVTATTSQTLIYDNCTKVSLITPFKEDDNDDAGNTKDIVMLRNLEITPPPQDLIIKATPSPNSTKGTEDNTAPAKRRSSKRTQSEQSDESSVSGRSKRQRKQTELFQVESVQKLGSTRRQPKPEPSRKQTQPDLAPPQLKLEEPGFQDVILYNKGELLAIRNEENTFFLCQLTENVRVAKPFVKVRWLDTEDGGETYFLTSHYDKVPQKSIIMPVELGKLKADKKKKQIFAIDDQAKHSILERLNRSINLPAE